MFSNNLTMMTDLYELTMMQGYFFEGNNDTVVFDVFYRKNQTLALDDYIDLSFHKMCLCNLIL